MLSKKALLVLVLSILAGRAHALEPYMAAGATHLWYSGDGFSEDAEFPAIMGKVGAFYDEYLSGEVRIAYGAGHKTVGLNGVPAEVELNSLYSLIVRGGMNAWGELYPYVAVGHSWMKVRISLEGFGNDPIQDWDSDISYGAGAEWQFNDSSKVFLEYMVYSDNSNEELEGATLGLSVAF